MDFEWNDQPYKYQNNTVDHLVTFDPNAGTLWAGALVQTETAASGVLDAVVAPRAPVSLSITGRAEKLNGGALGSSTVTLTSPSASAYEEARTHLVGEGFQPKGMWTFNETEFHSLNQSLVNLGMKSEWLSVELRAALESSAESKMNTMIYNFEQHYYTVSMDAPMTPESVFSADATLSGLKSYSDPITNPIGYVSEVTYGRRLMVLVNSSSRMADLKAAFTAEANLFAGKSTVALSNTQREIMNQAQIKVFSIGADSSVLVHFLGSKGRNNFEDFNTLFDAPSRDDLVRFGVPLSYRINYLRDQR